MLVFGASFLAWYSVVSGHRGDIGRFGNFRSEQKENSFPKGNLVGQASLEGIEGSVPDHCSKASVAIK